METPQRSHSDADLSLGIHVCFRSYLHRFKPQMDAVKTLANHRLSRQNNQMIAKAKA
jgi:hypothetical protein